MRTSGHDAAPDAKTFTKSFTEERSLKILLKVSEKFSSCLSKREAPTKVSRITLKFPPEENYRFIHFFFMADVKTNNPCTVLLLYGDDRNLRNNKTSVTLCIVFKVTAGA